MTITNEDNMVMMARYPDKYFDLAIVDPPYGIGKDWTKNRKGVHRRLVSSYDNSKIPQKVYFDELFRISKNQIIWGYNYYAHILPLTNNIIVWDKVLDYEKGLKSEGELAWTSIRKYPLRIYKHQWDGAKKGLENGKTKTIHPHQKPIGLYKWILNKYANDGDKIIDTHLGSGSLAIACLDMGFDLTACEIDKKHYEDAIVRINNYKCQLKAELI